ncbi:MAG TPA: SgcJ/EcaC family oxidoreductase [Gemmatimonadaceae bacterium]|nr:MAG: SgcJ/EcaC family oxidoreductase [Alphaproteobacteria bacterium]HKN59124.1 SgcJ/EcaC family oxidoreductase [Gemmatimonadaceae bacterium]
MPSSDELAISALYREMMEAWDRGSGIDFAKAMTPDVEFVGFDGSWFRGRDEAGTFHDELLKTHL